MDHTMKSHNRSLSNSCCDLLPTSFLEHGMLDPVFSRDPGCHFCFCALGELHGSSGMLLHYSWFMNLRSLNQATTAVNSHIIASF